MGYPGKKEKIVATIEARMTSSRLPGKVLLPLAGKPALELMIERLKHSKYLDGICVATTTNKEDDVIVELAKKLDVSFFRGSEDDVLGRVLGAAGDMRADLIVELTGDCPFADPELVDRGIEEFFMHDVDYASNTIPLSYPEGFDVQVFPTSVLADVDRLTDAPIDRVHVSFYIYTHPEKYRCHGWVADADSQGAAFRMTLDERDDYRALNMVAEALLPQTLNFSAREVVQYLRAHPEVAAQNAHVRQKEAYEL
jgi:spore coat polysaccharide biosynthesis protein SpsF